MSREKVRPFSYEHGYANMWEKLQGCGVGYAEAMLRERAGMWANPDPFNEGVNDALQDYVEKAKRALKLPVFACPRAPEGAATRHTVPTAVLQ